jgi:hypothetical protein
MSQILEEVLTSAVGFIIAMVIVGVVAGIGLYGYWAYANHVTLQNYLWPIAEVVPYKGSYYLAVINTGYELFVVKQIYLSNGSTINVNTKPLSHGQWLIENLNSLPTAVKVCSAVDPGICIVAPVHGWSMAVIKPPQHAVLAVVIDSCTFNLTKLNLTKDEEDLVLQAFHYSTHCNCTTHNNLTTCTCPWRLVWYGWSGGSVCYGGNLTFLIQPTHGEILFIKYALEGPNETKPNTIVIFNTNCTYWLHRLENLTKLPQTLLQQYALWGQLYSGSSYPLLECPS